MPMHQHPLPGSVIVFLTDRHNRLTSPDGASQELRNRAGDLMWSAASTHRSENLTSAPFEAVQIEPRKPNGASAPSSAPDKLDAPAIDPQHYHVEFENEFVRVLRVTSLPTKVAPARIPIPAVLVHLIRTTADTIRWDRPIQHLPRETGPLGGPRNRPSRRNLSNAPLGFIRIELKLARK
jgi:hypothetical protein